MKGQYQPLTALLITIIIITAAGSVYFWGLPIIEESRDNINLEKTESLMKNVNEKIKSVAINGGREKVTINAPATVTFENDSEALYFTLNTKGSVYQPDMWIPLSQNASCPEATTGILGESPPEVMCVRSEDLGDNNYFTTFMLKYRQLNASGEGFKISLVGEKATGSEDRQIVVEKKGAVQRSNVINSMVEINIL